jgi:hypothetical protein
MLQGKLEMSPYTLKTDFPSKEGIGKGTLQSGNIQIRVTRHSAAS